MITKVLLLAAILFSLLFLAFTKRFGGERWRYARLLWILIMLAGGGAGVGVSAQNTRLWATYYGGTDVDYTWSIASDVSGNVYMAGQTASTSGISSSGGFQNTYGGGSWDAFLVKFDASGNRLWATYYGGTGDDYCRGVATDALGNVYLAGYTTSTSGISSAGFQNTYGGGFRDGFLVKFDSNGNRLWATYYGGAGIDVGYSAATDISGNVYLSGYTTSTSGISSGGFQNTNGGSFGYDSFLVKFDAFGNRMWATYYGGTGDDYGYSTITDASGNVYMSGYTKSAAGISSGGFQNTYGGGGLEDAFLVKFDAIGNRLWATYYGGTAVDEPYSIATDASGNVYLAGHSTGTSGLSSGGFQNTYGGGSGDAFLVKFDAIGNRLWATYYGGVGDDYGFSTAIDVLGNIYMAGYTYSANNITSGGFQNILIGTVNEFVVKFDASGNRLCATYYGQGSSQGQVAVDGFGNVYLSGYTNSTSGISSGGFQNTYGGGNMDTYLVKFTSCANPLSTTALFTNILCNGQCMGIGTANPANGTAPYTYSWNTAPIQTTKTATGLCAGGYTVTVTDVLGATTTATITITQPLSAVSGSVSSTNASCNAQCNGNALVTALGGSPGYSYSWNTTPVQTSVNATGLCAGSYTCDITDANGCTTTQTVTITQPTAITAIATSTATTCGKNNGTATANVSGGTFPYTYSWSPSGGVNVTATGLSSGTYTAIVMDANGCTQTQTVTVVPSTGPTANAANDVTITQGQSATLIASGGGTYSWSNGATDVVITVLPSVTTIYCVTVTDANGCTDDSCVTVTIEPIKCPEGFFLPNAFSPNNDGENDELQIYYGNIACIDTLMLIIYDRWGEKVFQTTDPLFHWDGRYNGNTLNTCTLMYFMQATTIDGREIVRKGNISLVR